MRGHKVPFLAATLLLAAGCGGDGSTSSSVADPTTPASTPSTPAPDTSAQSSVADPTTPASTPSTPAPDTSAQSSVADPTTAERTDSSTAGIPQLLVADHEGVWLTSADGGRTQLVDGAVRWAIPDRVGGVLFQRVATGWWRPVHDPSSPSTAQWRWVGSGAAQPIWRLQPGGEPRILVDAPADGRLELIDTALVDGDSAVAFLRTRYFTITTADDRGPWWDSAIAELVVSDLDTGTERVLRTQDVGWEYSWREPSLGSRLALEAVGDYSGEGHWVELLSFDGMVFDPGFPLPSCGVGCELVADLPPTGDTLVSARTELASAEESATTVEVVSIDVTSGSENQRVTITSNQAAWPLFIDTLGEYTLVLTARTSTPADRPTLTPGDQGPWVQFLQDQLSSNDTYLVPDGIFGPRTEAATRAFQAASDLPATGIVDAATWDRLSGPFRLYDDPALIDPAGHATNITLTRSPTPVIYPDKRGPTITLWSGPNWPTTPDTEPATQTPAPLSTLRPDGLGRFDFGDPANELVGELEALLGPPSSDTSVTPDGPGPFEYLPQGFHAAYELRIVTWDAPDFQVVLSDVPYRGDHYEAPTPGTLTLMTWVTKSQQFRLGSDIGVGSTVVALRAQHPNVQLGTYSVCEDPYDPASFNWRGLHGAFDWDWVSDLQRELNKRDAGLAVDAEYGPRTAASVTALQQELDLDGGNGWIGPETVDALGLSAPDSARITLLLAGSRGTC